MGNPNGHLVHGLCSHPLYDVWQTMKQRCENPHSRGYRWYGAKGVCVCREWNDVTVFFDWAISHGYKKGLTIDRINTDGDYTPENCRWISIAEQQRNKSSNHLIEYHGERHSLTEWSKILGVPRTTLSNRIMYLGWSVDRAFGKRGATT